MANINVTVYDSTENKRVPVELPDDAPCNKIIAVLVQKLRLPTNGPDGAPSKLQIPPQEYWAADSGCPDAGGGAGAGGRHSAPAA